MYIFYILKEGETYGSNSCKQGYNYFFRLQLMVRSHYSAKIDPNYDDHDVSTVHPYNLDRVGNIKKGKVSSQYVNSI